MTEHDTSPDTTLLSDDLLSRIRERAAGYDRDNRFFTEDFAELADEGYLRALVPTEFGGLGLSLQQTARLQARLAGAAPATALAVNMHLVWTGIAKTLRDRGDDSLEFVLREAGQGEVFAFGLSEAGNDLVLFGSTTEARPESDGSYRFHGRKIFTSLSPAWTRLGTMGLDSTSDDAPKIVYGFIERTGGGFEIREDWDTLGMRATQSNTTVLDGARATADRVVRRLDPGPNPDPLVFAIFANFEILLAAVYTGIGSRALDLAVEAAHRRTSLKNDGRSYANDPDIRWRVAEAAIEQDALLPQLDALAGDVDTLADHGRLWFPKLVGLKVRATETARRVVDQAIRVSGGSTFFAGNELGRLYRDVLAGIFHPSDAESAHNTVANAWLGPIED
ncbi:Acyl-CoA dehydrogenase [Leifsonia sp. 98AMF]|uniref:acyl-CoA dehydrogenase family protein n=1 Tax=unclassified Leifsonia TaxID=2663824 RepID=UPI00087C607C|nr:MULTISPECIES: acyl-CoA dehydrogenase family protein [unclassified Leifsonia]SDH50429.1 Acyl-CoA dehydrogenase [Leifsonia sp. 197AMF]SDI87670.1 Acyl-CoA dehydrogenase [Leifsonia sp. 466MF]SDJ93926.1 Acyl-CoA dehydrogenase [Leifsonia sp. 157MF]SDN91038.1 Acyl-CoA dehydrogenase [Leifsonia sp. 509MF]SEN14841.1 Acyl-CoA dehydrogenase [Leifsonia sp. 467MF]